MNAAVQVLVKECAKSDSDVVRKKPNTKKSMEWKCQSFNPHLYSENIGIQSNTCGCLKSFMDVGSTVQQLTELTETGGDLFQDVDVCQTRDT